MFRLFVQVIQVVLDLCLGWFYLTCSMCADLIPYFLENKKSEGIKQKGVLKSRYDCQHHRN